MYEHKLGGAWWAFMASMLIAWVLMVGVEPALAFLAFVGSVVGFFALCFLITWGFAWGSGESSPKPKVRASLDAHRHEDLRQSLAFRLGKALNRVLNRRRGRALVRDNTR